MVKDNKLSIFTEQQSSVPGICNERQSPIYIKDDNFNFYPKKHIIIAITLCYHFALSNNYFILSRIVITK
jgi:hypothetical protein